MSTKILQVIGDIDSHSVKYTEQTLTDAQKEQARKNIGALPSDTVIPTVPTEEISANTAARHTHSNKEVLDGITSAKVSEWDSKSGGGASIQTVEGDLVDLPSDLYNENWVLLGEYDCSLEENQVETIKINKYNGLPFTAKKMFVYGRNVKLSASYAEIGTNKGMFQWGYTGNHTCAYLFPFNNGTYQLGETSNTYWTAVSIASQGQPFTETPFFPASEIIIKGRYCNFTGGTIKVWAVIEQ